MKVFRVLLFLFCCIPVVSDAQPRTDAPSLIGNWIGFIGSGIQTQEIDLTVKDSAGILIGQLTAFSVIDSAATATSGSGHMMVENSHIDLTLPKGFGFKGDLKNGSQLWGEVWKDFQTAPIVLEKEKVLSTVEADTSGIWHGPLALPNGLSIELVFHLFYDARHVLKGTMDSPDQGVKGIPVTAIYTSDSDLFFYVATVDGMYHGKLLSSDSSAGEWVQVSKHFSLSLKHTTTIATPKRPQEPTPPYPYDTIAVTVQNTRDSLALAGTLSVPRTKGKHPAIIMITGSGPQDRNESILGHKPFLVLADYLTRRGYAVLRCDDRGVGGSKGKFSSATSEDFSHDVWAQIEFLKSRPEIDAKKIGLLGHSEGAMIAPMIASRHPKDLAFLVLLGAPAEPIREFMLKQIAMSIEGKVEGKHQRDSIMEMQAKVEDIIIASQTPDIAQNQLQELFLGKTQDTSLAGMQKAMAMHAEINSINNPWFRYFLKYDPTSSLRQLRMPVLALYGEKDNQVSVTDAPLMKEALRADRFAEVKLFPSLNHLFQHSKTGGVEEYAKIEETISPEVLQTIAEWLATVK